MSNQKDEAAAKEWMGRKSLAIPKEFSDNDKDHLQRQLTNDDDEDVDFMIKYLKETRRNLEKIIRMDGLDEDEKIKLQKEDRLILKIRIDRLFFRRLLARIMVEHKGRVNEYLLEHSAALERRKISSKKAKNKKCSIRYNQKREQEMYLDDHDLDNSENMHQQLPPFWSQGSSFTYAPIIVDTKVQMQPTVEITQNSLANVQNIHVDRDKRDFDYKHTESYDRDRLGVSNIPPKSIYSRSKRSEDINHKRYDRSERHDRRNSYRSRSRDRYRKSRSRSPKTIVIPMPKTNRRGSRQSPRRSRSRRSPRRSRSRSRQSERSGFSRSTHRHIESPKRSRSERSPRSFKRSRSDRSPKSQRSNRQIRSRTKSKSRSKSPKMNQKSITNGQIDEKTNSDDEAKAFQEGYKQTQKELKKQLAHKKGCELAQKHFAAQQAQQQLQQSQLELQKIAFQHAQVAAQQALVTAQQLSMQPQVHSSLSSAPINNLNPALAAQLSLSEMSHPVYQHPAGLNDPLVTGGNLTDSLESSWRDKFFKM